MCLVVGFVDVGGVGGLGFLGLGLVCVIGFVIWFVV